MEKSRKRLTLNERVIIETLLNENKSKSYIASILEFLQKAEQKS
jgi:IS30 family transposase